MRATRSLLIGLFAVLLLSGCVKIDMDLTLNTDDTVDGVMVLAFSDEVAAMLGTDPESLWEEAGGDLERGLPPGSTQEPWSEDGYTGTRVTFDGVPLEEMAQANDPDTLRITREGDEFVVSGAMDFTDVRGAGTDQAMEGFDVRIAITFPGEVRDHNGRLEGRTVIWEPVPGERTELSARGGAGGDGVGMSVGGGAEWLPLLLGLGAVIVVAVALFVVLRARRERAAEAHEQFARQRWQQDYQPATHQPGVFPPAALGGAAQQWPPPPTPGGETPPTTER